MQLNVQEGEDELILDRVPDDAGHLVSQNVHNGSSLDLLRHRVVVWSLSVCAGKEAIRCFSGALS